MTTEADLGKIYEFVEKLDFSELSAHEKTFVLGYISEQDYREMRATINSTKDFFARHPAAGLQEKRFFLKRIITYPVELYKIAALILLVFAAFMFFKDRKAGRQELLALADTVYVLKTDTVFSTFPEILTVVKRRHTLNEATPAETGMTYIYGKLDRIYRKTDGPIEISPDDINILCKSKTANDFYGDSALTDFIVSLDR
jgi:hypothetical protein